MTDGGLMRDGEAKQGQAVEMSLFPQPMRPEPPRSHGGAPRLWRGCIQFQWAIGGVDRTTEL
jgi:hypothetical protein